MNAHIRGIIAAVALVVNFGAYAQWDTNSLPLVPPGEVPIIGTFWLIKGPLPGEQYPPLPTPPAYPNEPVYELPNGAFLVDNTSVNYGSGSLAMGSPMGRFGAMDDPGGSSPSGSGGSTPCPGFAQQVFSVLDTNYVDSVDTNLYNELLLFPTDTNTAPDLQIMLYDSNILLIRANHFDYSAD